ncbi:hypothetical protein C8R46DRAFT_1064644 [Mycena filopes]|nr:hypothetical protein C8R46DRAFT_1064644 [Mycena filopes]
MVLQYASVPWSSEQDHCGQVMSTHTLPNFHGIGIFLSTWPFVDGITMAVPRPTSPPTAPNPQNALAGVIATNPDFIMSTPASIGSWSEDPVGLQVMQKVKAVLYLGAQLNKRVGDTLAAKGVVLCSTYGAMEVGLVTPFFRSYGKDWEYFAVKPECNPVRVPEEDGSHLYTHAYLPSPSFVTCHTNTEVNGRPGCGLSDLLEQHPENPNLHRVYGRKDDIIIFSTGSKMNPVPIEAQLNRNSLVDAAVVFGHGRPYPGVLIQLKREFQAELADVAKRTRVLEALWASVKEANETSPTHFRIRRQMVLLGNSERPFAVTSKLQPRRKLVLESYDEEIQSAYAAEA